MFGSGYENCPEFEVFIDKGVAILDLPMILLPNEIINKYMRNMKN